MAHKPVLYKEIIHALCPHDKGLYVDGPVGAGGHARGILEASSPDGQLLGLDLDPQALSLAREVLSPFGDRATLIQSSYRNIKVHLKAVGWSQVDGVLLDLGVSSMQLDTAERGFSFRYDAPLDMRFDPNGVVTAADLVNGMPENELADLIYTYGEERRSRQIARAIVSQRPIYRTLELAEVIRGAIKTESRRRHPATRTFQALRIAVNDELETIEEVLPEIVNVLAPGGRLAVISFHSLEDRLVKNYFRKESQDCVCPPRQIMCNCDHHASLREISRRPVRPEEPEIQSNPRARSDRLRIAEKLQSGMRLAN